MRGKRFFLATTLVSVVAAAIAFALFRSGHWPGRGARRHNVLLITLDTTRADHLGCYGYPQPVSPRIDGLAERGTLFVNAYTTASVTPVSHASILTGQYPYRHGLRVMHGLSGNRLPQSAVTLAEILKDAGYKTAAFVSAFPAGSRFGMDQGFETFDEAFLEDPIDRIVDASGIVYTGDNQRRADATTALALDWLAGASGNFFVWLHYFDPHDAQILPPPEFLERFPAPAGELPEQLRYIYDLELRYMDQQIGRVFDALEAAGRLEDTIVVVVADHGQGLGDHHWWSHGLLYQEQIKAPLIIRVPAGPSGRRVEHLVRTVDILPTIVDLVGVDPGRRLSTDGTSLVSLLQGGADNPGHVAYADSVNMLTYATEIKTPDVKDDMLFAVTDGRWKYIRHLIREAESELYDLARDPRELTNLYRERPPELERLRSDLEARRFEPVRSLGQGRMSPGDLERLRSLGYVK